MASIQSTREKKTGKLRYRVQFYDLKGNRQTLRLGIRSRREVEECAEGIEALRFAAKHKTAIDIKTQNWIQREAGDQVVEFLASVGLCRPREEATLKPFIDAYIKSREDVGPRTTKKWENARNKLVAHFGETAPLRDILPGHADEWRQSLVNLKMAPATVSKQVKYAKHFFLLAERKGLIAKNPFAHLTAGGERNEARLEFISHETINQVLDATTDREWRLVIALARFGGLRCPSEILELQWTDVDWERQRITVRSPKTEKQGKPFRVIPIFPELKPFLEAAFFTPEGSVHVVSKYRDTNSNLRTRLLRTIRKAKVKPWGRLFQNLRQSRD